MDANIFILCIIMHLAEVKAKKVQDLQIIVEVN